MARDIPVGKKMPSVSIGILAGKKPGPTPPPAGGGADMLPGQPGDDMAAGDNDSTFKCPSCGAPLSVESKEEDAAEDMGSGSPPPMGKGGYGS